MMKHRPRDSLGNENNSDSWKRRRDLFFVVGLCFLCVAFGVVVGTWIASSIAYAGDRVSTVGNVGKTPKLPDVSDRDGRTWIEGTRGWDESGNYLYPVEASDSVGIGVTPTAKLDIDGLVRIRGGTPGSNKVLTSDANGLANWATPSTSDPDAWKITGNAGTTAGTNFIGTTDGQAFDIRTNNTLRTRITTKGQIEIYNTGRSVFIGEGAGANDDLTTNRQVFVGYQAGYSNTSGYDNTAIGYQALCDNTTGRDNIAVGREALANKTTGNGNVAVGRAAGGALQAGSDYNTCIGDVAGNVSGTFDNTIAIGYIAGPSASNTAVIGNSSMTSIGGYEPWTNLSDKRFKRDIRENVPGLAFITKLRPITYHFDMDKLQTFLNIPDSLRLWTAEAQKERITYTGFIAQEVEEAANEVGFDFSGVDKPKNDKSHYGLRYAEFVVPLVKAVQEQQEMIEQLQKVVNEQQKEIEKLKRR
jgi:hypothetical protein